MEKFLNRNSPRFFVALAAGLALLVALFILADSGTSLRMILSALALAVAFLAVGAFWQKDVISKITLDQAALEERLGYRADLLNLISASEPRAIIITDRWERILFANREAARRAGRDSEALIGNTIASVLGEHQARIAKGRIQAAFKSKSPVFHVDEDQTGLLPRIIQTSYVPVANTQHINDAVLITETDITTVIVERERREKMLRQILDVVVAIVDKRDPFAAGHSALVGKIAHQVADHMGLEDGDIETAEISGMLMNFGKVLVPQEILTKTTALTPEELKLVRESMMRSADVLSLIHFDLPVVETLRQVHERFDGKGTPEGRRGTNIIVTARICTAVNVFVALISSRAHRAGLGIDGALNLLSEEAGQIYDPTVIEALADVTKSPDVQQMISRLSKAA